VSKPFGNFIRDRRRLLGLTQRQVTEALGLKSIAFLSDIEAGNRKPSRELLPALARILETDTETLTAHDMRSPLLEARSLLEAQPEKAVVFHRVMELARELGIEEVLRRIENPAPAVEPEPPAKPRSRPRRSKTHPGMGSLPLG
jgi:transcriptional regulator with XRE-family HTH domain